MNHTARKISRWILAFIGALLLFATLSMVCIRLTLFNENFMIQQVHRSEYTKTIRKDMTQGIQDLGRGSNVPPKVLENVVSEEAVQANVDNYIRSIYQEVPFELQGQEQLKSTIMKNVTNYANEHNYVINDQTKKDLENLTDSASKNYASFVEIPYLLSYGQKVMAYKSSLTLITIVVGVAFFIVFIGLLITTRMKHQKLRWSGVTFLGAGLMLIVLPLVLYFNGIFTRLAISSEGLYRFLTQYLTAFDLSFVYAGILISILAVLTVAISERLRFKKLHSVN